MKLNEPLNQLSLLQFIPPETRELALNIRVAIATQGLVWLNNQSSAEKTSVINKQTDSKTNRGISEKKSTQQTNQSDEGKLIQEVSQQTQYKLTDSADSLTNKSDGMEKHTTNRGGDSKQTANRGGDSEQTANRGEDSAYLQALQELSDPLIAVKGHALIEITKLIKRFV